MSVSSILYSFTYTVVDRKTVQISPACRYPIMMNATAASLDPDLAGGAIGYIAALGQCGSALFPWITGALAGSYGVWALQRRSYFEADFFLMEKES
jgi:MFS family permease